MTLSEWLMLAAALAVVAGLSWFAARCGRMVPDADGWTDLGPLALWVRRALAGYLAVQVLVIFVQFALIGMYADLDPFLPSAEVEDAPTVVIADIVIVVQLLVLIVTAITFLRWTYRYVANARLLGPTEASPGWAVGRYFLPILNLWKPFTALRDAWQVSTMPSSPETVPVPAIMRWWWGLWITTSIIDNASFRLSLRADTAAESLSLAYVDLVSAIGAVPMTWLLIRIVGRLTSGQPAIPHSAAEAS